MTHPPYDTAAPGDTLGLRHLREALEDIEWPKRTSEIREQVGNWRMPVTGTRFETVSRWLDGVPERTFRSPEDLAEAVARAHPDLRE